MWSSGSYVTVLLFVSSAVGDEFHIAWLAPNVTSSGTSAPTSVGALALALEHIDSHGILTGDSFKVLWKNSFCDKKKAISSIYEVLVVDMFAPDLVIGPPCSNAMMHVGELAGYRNLPVFGWLSESSSFSNKDTYNSLIRSYGPISSIAEFLVQFLEYMTWFTVELISTTSYSSLGNGVYEAITNNNAFTLVRWQDGAVDEESVENIKSYYETLKKEARIVVLAVPPSSLRTWLLAAYDCDMVSGDFVFLVINNNIPSASMRDSVVDQSFIENNDGRNDDARVAYENVLLVTQSLDFVGSLQTFKTEADAAGSSQILSDVGLSSITASSTDDTSPFLHDALILWAQLVNESKAEGLTKSEINGSYLLQKAQNRAFIDSYWATGDMHLDQNGDRKPDFWVLDLGSGGQFSPVIKTQLDSSSGGSLSKTLNEVGTFLWGDGSTGYANRPKDIPDCGFENENCPNNLPYIVPPVVIGVVIIALIIAFFVVRKYQFEQSIKQMRWKIEKADVHLKADKKYMGSTMSRASSIRQSRTSYVTQEKKYRVNMSGRSSAEESSNNTGDPDNQQIFIQIAVYKKNTVAVKVVRKKKLKLTRELLVELKNMTDMKHANVASFVGATTEPPSLYEVWEYCPKGSLEDIIFNDSVKLDSMFKFSLATDTLKGLKYLHKSSIGCHGNLKSSNCIVDGRWVCKLCDYSLTEFHRDTEKDAEVSDFRKFSGLFWASPEILRNILKEKSPQKIGSQEGDIYAAAVILKELFSRNGPYTEFEDQYTPSEIVEKVASDKLMKPFRPDLIEAKTNKLPTALIELIQRGWHEDPVLRPSAGSMLKHLEKANPNKSSNVMDNIMKMLESYSNNLEGLVQERAKQVAEEKKRSEALLYRMLPKSVAENLKKGLHVAPEVYDAVSIYFSDIVSFTSLASKSTPMQVVTMLNELYTEFDSITNQHDVYKVETIGDAYMYVSGLPVRNEDRHAVEVTNCAMDLLSYVTQFKVPHIDNYELRIRIGLHTGPVVAGVVGITMPRYCLFGDSVTIASAMESGGSPMRIHFSESTFQYLSKYSGYLVAERGVTEIKGKKFKTYFIVQRQNYSKLFPDFDELSSSDKPPCKKLPITSGKLLNVRSTRPSMESGYYESDSDDSHAQQQLHHDVNVVSDKSRERLILSNENVSQTNSGDETNGSKNSEAEEKVKTKTHLTKTSSNGKNFHLLSQMNKVSPVIPDITVQDMETTSDTVK